MFRFSMRMSYTKTCGSSLLALKEATTNKLLPQDIIPPTQYDTTDNTGYCALARTLTFQHPCAAVFHNREDSTLSIAFNTHARSLTCLLPAQKFQYPPVWNVITQYMNFLRDSAGDPVVTKDLTGLVVSRSYAYPLFRHPIPGALKRMGFDTDENDRCVDALDQIQKAALGSRCSTDKAYNTKAFFDLYSEVLFRLSKSTDDVQKRYAQEMLQPLLDITKVHTLFATSALNYRLLPNQEGHHAELAVLKDLQTTTTPISGPEIGISKLACFTCYVVLKYHEVKTIGTHGKFYSSPPKQLLQDFFTDDVSCTKAVTVLNKYIASQPSLKNTVVRNWDDLPQIRMLNLNAESSTSLPSDSYVLSTEYLRSEESIKLLGVLGLNEVVSDLISNLDVF